MARCVNSQKIVGTRSFPTGHSAPATHRVTVSLHGAVYSSTMQCARCAERTRKQFARPTAEGRTPYTVQMERLT